MAENSIEEMSDWLTLISGQAELIDFEVKLSYKLDNVDEFNLEVYNVWKEIIDIFTQNPPADENLNSRIYLAVQKSSVILKYLEFLWNFDDWIKNENLQFNICDQSVDSSRLLDTDFSEYFIVFKQKKIWKDEFSILEFYLKFIIASTLINNNHEQLFIDSFKFTSKYIYKIDRLQESKELLVLLFTDCFNVSLYWIKSFQNLFRSKWERTDLSSYNELLDTIDYWFVNFLMNSNAWFLFDTMTKICISLVKNLSYEAYHKFTMKNLLTLSEDIYSVIDKINKSELNTLKSICYNISVYLNVIFSLNSEAVKEFISYSASKLSMHLSLIIPIIPIIQNLPDDFIGNVKIIWSKLIRLLERLTKSQTAESITEQNLKYCKDTLIIFWAISENYFDWWVTEKENLDKILEQLIVLLINKYTNNDVKDYELIEYIIKLSLRSVRITKPFHINNSLDNAHINFK